jgi:hypothetical protein
MAITYVWSEQRQCMVAEAVHAIEQAKDLTDEQKYGDTTITAAALLPTCCTYHNSNGNTELACGVDTAPKARKRGRVASFSAGPTATPVTTQLAAESISKLLERYNTTNKSQALFLAVQELLNK